MLSMFLAAAIVSIAPVNSSAPNRQPEMAASSGLTALVFGSQGSIWFAASKDGAQSFAKPVEVASVPALALGRHRGPHVVVSGKTVIVSAVFGKTVATGPHAHGLPADGDLVAWRSEDEGRSWSAPVVINDVPAAAREGLHAMTANSAGVLAAAWLDLRTNGTKLYGSYSNDHGQTWSKNVLLFESPDGTICQCCSPSLAVSKDGGFQVMFRNAVSGDRDLYLLDWTAGSQPQIPRKLGQGSWHLDACPMDGGGVVQMNGKTVTAWRREDTVYLDEFGTPEAPLGTGKDVSIAATKKGAYVSWTAADGIEVHTPGQTRSSVISQGAFSTLLTLPNGKVAVAWEQDGAIRISTLD